MPYIAKEKRAKLDHWVEDRPIADLSIGELNYLLTKMLLAWCQPITYANINQIMGILSSVGFEFYRRLAAVHEDKKMEENGDVY